MRDLGLRHEVNSAHAIPREVSSHNLIPAGGLMKVEVEITFSDHDLTITEGTDIEDELSDLDEIIKDLIWDAAAVDVDASDDIHLTFKWKAIENA